VPITVAALWLRAALALVRADRSRDLAVPTPSIKRLPIALSVLRTRDRRGGCTATPGT